VKKECEKIPGGLASGANSSEFDQGQLMKGIHVELEHTPDIAVAMEIALDHLTEDPRYYIKLDAMERGACDDAEEQFGPVEIPALGELYGVPAHEVPGDHLDPLGTGLNQPKHPMKFKRGLGRKPR